MCSTPAHCAGVHTVCGEGAEGYFIESVGECACGKIPSVQCAEFCTDMKAQNIVHNHITIKIQTYLKIVHNHINQVRVEKSCPLLPLTL